MSVIEPEGRTMGPAPAAPARERDEAGRFAPSQEAEPETQETQTDEPDTFPREYVESLRDENAKLKRTLENLLTDMEAADRRNR